MRRRTANRKRSNNRIPQSTLFALALALSAAATSAQIPAKLPGEPRPSAGSDRRIIVSIADRTDEVAQIFGPAPGSSSTQTQAARNEVRFPSADEPGGDR